MSVGVAVHAPRILVVHLPAFRLERCGHGVADVVVLVGEGRNALRVLSATPAAHRKGIRCGMTLSEARALVPEVRVEPVDEPGEREDLCALSLQLRRVSPITSALPPCALAAELEGVRSDATSHAEDRLLVQVREHLRDLGHLCQVVVSDTLEGAHLLAAWGRRSQVVASGQERLALASLPVEALSPPPLVQPLLFDLGLTTVGAVASLPPAALAARFGGWGEKVLRLLERPLLQKTSRRGLLEPACVQELPFPVDSLEPLLFVFNRLLLDLREILETTDEGVVRLEMELSQEEGGHRHIFFRTGRPTRDPTLLFRLLRRNLEGVQFDGPVTRVRISAEETAPFHASQKAIIDGSEPSEPLPDLVARLLDNLGNDAIFRPSALDSWRPESAWEATGPSPSLQTFSVQGMDPDPVQPHERWRRDLPARHPALLLSEPRPITLEPGRVCIEGRWFRAVDVVGVEVLEGDWWDAAFARAYSTIHLEDGRLAWVYEEMGQVFLHGWFDQGMPG